MAYRQNITLADGASSPANHVYVPLAGEMDGWISFLDGTGSTGVSAEKWKLKTRSKLISSISTDQVSGVNVIEWQGFIPVMETLGTTSGGYGAVPKVAHFPSFTLKMQVHERSVEQDRAHLAAIIANLAAHSIFKNGVKQYDVVS